VRGSAPKATPHGIRQKRRIFRGKGANGERGARARSCVMGRTGESFRGEVPSWIQIDPQREGFVHGGKLGSDQKAEDKNGQNQEKVDISYGRITLGTGRATRFWGGKKGKTNSAAGGQARGCQALLRRHIKKSPESAKPLEKSRRLNSRPYRTTEKKKWGETK